MKFVISGASRGLGRELILSLCRQGHHVFGFARSGFQGELPPTARFRPGVNVAEPDFLEAVQSELPDCDVLVNNVGVAYDGILATQGSSGISRLIDVNLTSILQLTKQYIRARLARRLGGNIISISSIIGVRGYAGLAAYSASKAGLDGMTRALAREMGAKGFRVNSVLPGYLETEMSKSLNDVQRGQIIRRTPLGRLGTADDIVPVIEFLASEKSRFVTGQCLIVDGGITV